jgi:hypothetical protein
MQRESIVPQVAFRYFVLAFCGPLDRHWSERATEFHSKSLHTIVSASSLLI